jgi:hypothetical protein
MIAKGIPDFFWEWQLMNLLNNWIKVGLKYQETKTLMTRG